MQEAKKQEEMFADDLSEQTWDKINTLKGDVRDNILEWFKEKKPTWNDQNERQQVMTIGEIEGMAGELVRNVAKLVATRGFDYMSITLSKYTVDREKALVSTTFSLPRTMDNIRFMDECLDTTVQMVPMTVAEFLGMRAAAKPDVIGDLRLPIPEANGKAAKPEAVVADARTTPAAATPPHDPETGEIKEEQPPAQAQ